MKKFWNWIRDEGGSRTLRLEGPIDEESFWGDEVTPKAFREELESDSGDITVWVNSPGGNVFAAAEIYTMRVITRARSPSRSMRLPHPPPLWWQMAGNKVLMAPRLPC